MNASPSDYKIDFPSFPCISESFALYIIYLKMHCIVHKKNIWLVCIVFQFKPGRPLAKNDLGDSSPTLNDRVHVLVSVIPASSVTSLPDEIVKKMREVRLAASEIGNTQFGQMFLNENFFFFFLI